MQASACGQQDDRNGSQAGTRVEFVLFDVFYEDGSRRSNRKVPSTGLAASTVTTRLARSSRSRTSDCEKSGFRRSRSNPFAAPASAPIPKFASHCAHPFANFESKVHFKFAAPVVAELDC